MAEVSISEVDDEAAPKYSKLDLNVKLISTKYLRWSELAISASAASSIRSACLRSILMILEHISIEKIAFSPFYVTLRLSNNIR